MTDDSDPVADGLRRALEAAELANDAAEDVSRLGKAHQDFSDRVMAAQKRTTALAGGALAGAAVALGLAALVYFRSVADLREAADLQAEAVKLVVEQVLEMKTINEGAEDRAKAIEARLDELATTLLERLEMARADEPKDDDTASVVTEVQASEERILAALAEMDLRAVDGAAITEQLARIEAGMLRASAAPAKPDVPVAQKAEAPRAEASSKSAEKKKPRAVAAPEPNPFAYP